MPPAGGAAAPRAEAAVGTSARGEPPEELVTFEEVQRAARIRRLDISLKTLGPFYRCVCRDAPTATSRESSSGGRNDGGDGGDGGGRVLAVTNGFVVGAPFKLMHCDTLQVFTKGLKGSEGERVRGALGLGLLLGGAVFAYGRSCGCNKAEILAINDDDTWHARLVRYYSYFGFRPVCKVGGNGLSDLPHMLVWGGEGTRMDADIDAMLAKWTPALRRTLRNGAPDATKS